MEAARAGDAAAFAGLVARHYPVLEASCRRVLDDPEAARDAAQEATVRAMLGIDRLREPEHFGAWLVGIGLNVCRGLLGDARRRRSFEAAGLGPDGTKLADEHSDPADRVAAAELARCVRAAIGALPPGQRRAVALFYLGGLTHAETAAELGTRPAAVKTRLHKARRTLRRSLNDTYEEYIAMTDETPQLIPMRVAELRRTSGERSGVERHIVFLEDDRGRRLPIWIGPAEATAIALILEGVELPRPGAYQFAATLLAGAGARLREVRISALTRSTFYAEATLDNGAVVDARPSDALALALVTGVPIRADAEVLRQAEATERTRTTLIEEANAATDDARVIAAEVLAAQADIIGALDEPAD